MSPKTVNRNNIFLFMILMILLSPSVLFASSPAPDRYLNHTHGDTLSVFGNDATLQIDIVSSADELLITCSADPSVDIECVTALPSIAFGEEQNLLSAVSATHLSSTEMLVTDPVSATIWRIDFSVDPTATLWRTTTFEDDVLVSPTAITSSGETVFFSEGMLQDETFGCGDMSCMNAQPGGIHWVRNAEGGVLGSVGELEAQLPLTATKALTRATVNEVAELWAITGSPSRFLRFDIASNAFIANWSIPRTVSCDGVSLFMNEPHSIAAMRENVIIGSDNAIALYDVNGNFLRSIWMPDYTHEDLDGAARLIDFATEESGEHLFVLFEMEDSSRRLVHWTYESIAPRGSTVHNVNLKSVDGYTSIQPAIDIACTGDTITVARGNYREELFIYGKALRIAADDDIIGDVVIQPPLTENTSSVVTASLIGSPGLVLDGLVITQGAGTLLDDSRYGGGIFAYEADVRISRSFIIGNSADFGGGIAVIAPRNTSLTNVGIIENTASSKGGGIYSSGEGLFPVATVDLAFSSFYRNRNETEGFGGGLHIETTMIDTHSSILFDNGDVSISFSDEEEIEGCLLWSDLVPQNEWAGLPLFDCDEVSQDNIHDDPLFVLDGSDWLPNVHLHYASPAIDAGHPNTEFTEPDSTRADMGMYGGPAGDWYPQWMPEEIIGDDDDSAAEPEEAYIGIGLQVSGCQMSSSRTGPLGLFLVMLVGLGGLMRKRSVFPVLLLALVAVPGIALAEDDPTPKEAVVVLVTNADEAQKKLTPRLENEELVIQQLGGDLLMGDAWITGVSLRNICPTPSLSQQYIVEQIEKAQRKIDEFKIEDGQADLTSLRQTLTCLVEPIDPEILWRLYFFEAVAHFYRSDEATRDIDAALHRTLVIRPSQPYDNNYPPDLGQRYRVLQGEVMGMTHAKILATVGDESEVWIDGIAVLTTGVSVIPGEHLLQFKDVDGKMRGGTFIIGDNGLALIGDGMQIAGMLRQLDVADQNRLADWFRAELEIDAKRIWFFDDSFVLATLGEVAPDINFSSSILAKPGPKFLLGVGGGYQFASGWHYGLAAIDGSIGLIGALRLDVFGRVGIGASRENLDGSFTRPILILGGVGPVLRINTDPVAPRFGLYFQLAGNSPGGGDVESIVLPGAAASAGVEFRLREGLLVRPNIEVGFVGEFLTVRASLQFVLGK